MASLRIKNVFKQFTVFLQLSCRNHSSGLIQTFIIKNKGNFQAIKKKCYLLQDYYKTMEFDAYYLLFGGYILSSLSFYSKPAFSRAFLTALRSAFEIVVAHNYVYLSL